MSKTQILLNRDISGEILKLIETSKEYCFLVTPYYKPWPLLDRTLEIASSQGKHIIFIFRFGDIKDEHINKLSRQGFDIHLVEKLHSKLYLNERIAILTSMNLYDASKEHNYEVGYKFSTAYEAKKFKTDVIDNDILALKPKLSIPGRYNAYIQKLFEESNEQERKKNEDDEEHRRIKEEKLKFVRNHNLNRSGYCIRCSVEIPMNPGKPYCDSCFKTWSSFGNVEYIERYCHSCGRDYHSSMAIPLCNDCFSYYRKSAET